MPFRGKRSRRVKVARRTRKAGRRTKVVSKNIKTYVKRAISRNMENKVWESYGNNIPIVTTVGSTPTFLGNLLPQPSQSVTQSGRIGNEIKIRKGYVRGYVNLLPYNATSNPLSTPVMVKMWLVSCKYLNTATLSSTNISTDFFEIGSSTAGLQGNLIDTVLSVNKDNWTVHKTKQFELGATYASTSGAVGTGGYFDNSKMIMPFYFSFGNKFRTSLKYNDASSNVPTNRNLFLLFQAVYANGSTTGLQICQYTYNTRVEYEDA